MIILLIESINIMQCGYLIQLSVISEMAMLRNLEIIGLERKFEDGDLEGLDELKYLADESFIALILMVIVLSLPEKLEIINKSKLIYSVAIIPTSTIP